ncbi:MAG: FAD-binding oxidoreductase [Bacteroidetes bacterium]|nr:FAD-binding oxidoreductase [Bacteroidota bacterium]
MLSYWEKQSFVHYNHIVVGAGIVGLSVAIELKEKYPNKTMLVLERGLLPTGASSRNAGFACMGSLTELLDDLQYGSEETVLKLYELRKKGLEKLRARLGDNHIGYATNGSYELINETELPALEQMERINQWLLPITHQPAFTLANEKIKALGFSEQYTKALIQNNCEGELHTGKMLRALTDYAIGKGIEIKTGAEVTRYTEETNNVIVSVADPVRDELLQLQADNICICTNAFAKDLLPEEDIIPGRGQVLITEPIEGLKFKGIYHFDKGYYYFREIDGRVLFGGGRNLDFEGEATTELQLNEKIQNDLDDKIRTIILPGTDFKVAQRWSGIMAFGNSKQPLVKKLSPHVFGAFRMGGMGVAIGSEVATRVVSMM